MTNLFIDSLQRSTCINILNFLYSPTNYLSIVFRHFIKTLLLYELPKFFYFILKVNFIDYKFFNLLFSLIVAIP